jgi:hypothetical protein
VVVLDPEPGVGIWVIWRQSRYHLQWLGTIFSVPGGERFGCRERHQTIIKYFMVHVRLKPRYLG